MEVITNVTAVAVQKAASSLLLGNLVAFPTETVYGIGADANNAEAVARVYSVKNRPTNHPLIVHIGDSQDLIAWANQVPNYAWKIATNFWPGPITLVLKRSSLAKNWITGGQNTVGLRMPNHKIALSLLHEFKLLGGLGIAAPSANRFGFVSATSAHAIIEDLGPYLSFKDSIIDCGPSDIGLESAIIDCTENQPRLLRPGSISISEIEDIIAKKVAVPKSFLHPRVSGNLKSHYAPRAKVLLNIKPPAGSGYFALSDHPTPSGVHRLGSPNDSKEFAKTLYEAFRNADKLGLSVIVVRTPKSGQMLEAIYDRVTKASANSINDSQ